MKVLFAVVALACVGLALSTPVTPTSCGNGAITVESLDINPWPLTKDGNITGTMKAKVASTVSSASFTLKVKTFGVEIFKKTGDACAAIQGSGYSCPLQAGEITVSTSAALPSITPKGSYDIEFSAVDGAGNTLFCYDVSVKVCSPFLLRYCLFINLF